MSGTLLEMIYTVSGTVLEMLCGEWDTSGGDSLCVELWTLI